MKSIFTKAKTTILALLTAIFMLPCVFVFSACTNSKNPSNPQPQTKDAVLMQALDALDNFTGKGSMSYVVQEKDFNGTNVSHAGSWSSTFNNVEIKVDGNDFSLKNIINYDVYKVNGSIITKNYHDWEVDISEQSQEYDTLATGDFINALIDIAIYMDEANYSVVKKESGAKEVILSIDLTKKLQAIRNLLLSGFRYSMDYVIDETIRILTGKEFCVVNFINNIKCNLTNETTVKDIFALIEEEIGIDLLPLASSVYGLIYNENHYSYTPSEIVDVKIADLFEMSKMGIIYNIEKYTIPYLKYFTLGDLISNSYLYNHMAYVLITNINKVVFEFTISLNANGNISNLKLSGNADIDVADFDYDEYYDEYYDERYVDEKNYTNYVINGKIDLAISNIGQTTVSIPNCIIEGSKFNTETIYLTVSRDYLIDNDYKLQLKDILQISDSFSFTNEETDECLIRYNKTTGTLTLGDYIESEGYIYAQNSEKTFVWYGDGIMSLSIDFGETNFIIEVDLI